MTPIPRSKLYVTGLRVRSARQAIGLSARELAEAVGVTTRAIERNEGRDIPRERQDAYLAAARRLLVDRLNRLDEMISLLRCLDGETR